MVPGVRGSAESYAPAYVLARPAPPAHEIDRPGTLDDLDRAIDAHGVVLVVAPAGYGKTSALSAWARRSDRRVAWLSLTSDDKHPQRLERGLISALEPILGAGAADLADLLRREVDDAVVVLDDVHLVGANAAGVLGTLVERAPAGLRIVLVSRRRPLLRLQRMNAAGGLGEISASQLAFTADEVRRAAQRLDRPLSDEQAAGLLALTAGWPVAVRLALMSGPEPTTRLATGGQLRLATLTDYLIEEVLADLPPVLRDLLLRVSVSDWLTGRLATELSGDSLAPAMLEDAIARGIPLERRGQARGEPVYRWHPLVAEQCRALLRRREPMLADELHLRAARFLETSDPSLAARHAVAGRSPQLAAEIVARNWLTSVLRGDFAVLEEVCLQLPSPWSERPDVLLIRATCRRAVDDMERAVELRARAELLAAGQSAAILERYAVTALLSDLLVIDDAEQLIDACQQVRRLLSETTLLRAAERGCAWFLVGFAEVRLRRMTSAVPALREAAAIGGAEGLDDIAERARANLVFALAFSGDFAAAEALLEQSPGDDDARWRRIEGRPEWFAAAWMSFWRDDLERARVLFAKCVAAGGAVTSFATMSRIWTVMVAATIGDTAYVRAAEAGLADVRDATVQGLPLGVYRSVALAALALAEDRPDTAVELLDAALPGAVNIPSTLALAVEIYLSCGRTESARACLSELEQLANQPSYIAVAADVAHALVAELDGRSAEAHSSLEQALRRAESDGILRPFVRPDPALRALLAVHAQRGSAHEELVAIALARQEERSGRLLIGRVTLSAREREVLGYLQTSLSSVEIASALFISANTLKTHQRSIYRKLGVSSRREAIKAAQSL